MKYERIIAPTAPAAADKFVVMKMIAIDWSFPDTVDPASVSYTHLRAHET